ncbi:MAG TPA: AcrB/AcrD/AcrF family protein [Acidobacteria bacterium]|nr:AcrB/AcrD/AcrF family protein [Acidobacteriota bacterium]
MSADERGPRAGSGEFFQVTVNRPVAILMVTLAVMIFGLFSYRLLPLELMPDISYPSLTVRTQYEGAAPQEVEENLTRPLEEALGVVGGLTRISSISRAGLSDVTLEFTWETPMNQAWQEVTERLDTVLLPEEATKPLLLRYDPALDPVIRLALSSTREEDHTPVGLRRQRTFADQELRRRLELVDGVAAVRVLGGLEEQVSVDLSEEALRRTGLSIQQVAQRLRAENVNLAGGDIKEGDTQYLVRTVGEFLSLGEIADLVVAQVGGRDVRLADLGTVRTGWADRKVITRLDRREAIELEIQKEADANIVAMAAAVRAAIDGRGDDPGLRALLPDGWQLDLVADRSTFIEASVREVESTALLGGLLAVCVLFFFLRRADITGVIALAIPVSVAATFAPMSLGGVSLNIMSLGGLALGIGMLVDSGIVVVESIARCREEGDGIRRSVIRGTSEVGTAVVASTLTTVAVFFPMVFVEGVAGQVFGDLALTVVFALLASLLVSVFLVPALTAWLFGLRAEQAAGRRAAGWLERGREVLRYRSLGPLSDPGLRGPARWVAVALASLPPLALFGLLAVRLASRLSLPWPGGLRDVSLVLAVPTALAVLVNAGLRLRAPGGPGARLGAALVGLLTDPLLVVVEGAWLMLAWVIALVAALASGVARVFGRLTRILLWPALALFDLLFGGLQRVYPRVLRASLRHRAAVLALAAAALAATVWGVGRLDSELMPEVHQREFTLELTLPVGTPVEQTLEAVAPLESWAVDDPRVDRVLLKVGADPEEGDSSPEEGEHTARMTLHVADSGLSAARAEEAVVADLREQLAGLPDLEAKVTRPVLFTFRTPIEVEIEAYDLELLRLLGESVRRELETLPQLADVKSSARAGSPEVQITYDRRALVRFGLDIREVADLVRTKIKGASATEYRKKERRIDVVVRLQEGDRATVRQLRNLVVNPGESVPIALSAVADIRIAAGPADIRRVGQRRVALVSANLAEGGLGGASEAIRQRLAAMDWPEGTSWRLAGQVQEMQRSTRSLWMALALSIFLVYVVMAIQFESMLHPLLIMITVPLALLGVVLVLSWLAVPLSVVVFLGMIMLAGIVVNNAIVLVDYVNTLRGRGEGLEEAVVRAGAVRLRPILMTTATTVLGLLPMALGLGDGAEIRMPMAVTVIAGLLSSTVLTLVVIPTAYAALESVRGADR